MHAEQAAIANAYMAGERSVSAIAVTGGAVWPLPPVPARNVSSADLQVILPRKRPVQVVTIAAQRIRSPGSQQTRGALPPPKHRLKLRTPADALCQAAFAAACSSYAPYTRSYAGVALPTSDQRIVSGSYLENVAFNPSLSPLQAALAVLLSRD